MAGTEAECLGGLRDAEQRLTEAHRYDRVVLWFEHDCYDELILARCLSRLAEGPLPACLELICIDRHPDVPRFNGLGQLGPAALAGLWPARQAVIPEQIALGQAIWAALRQPNPLPNKAQPLAPRLNPMLIFPHGKNITRTVRRLVRHPGLDPPPASTRRARNH